MARRSARPTGATIAISLLIALTTVVATIVILLENTEINPESSAKEFGNKVLEIIINKQKEKESTK